MQELTKTQVSAVSGGWYNYAQLTPVNDFFLDNIFSGPNSNTTYYPSYYYNNNTGYYNNWA